MRTAKDGVTSYQQALGRNDGKAARAHLKDALEFQGPRDTIHTADDYLAALRRLYPMVEKVDVKRVFSAGEDVVVLRDLHFQPPMPPTVVRGGVVRRQRRQDLPSAGRARPEGGRPPLERSGPRTP